MSIAFLPDLQASRDLKCCITILTPFREFKYTTVRDLNEDAEYAVLFTPQSFGDTSTTTTVLLSDIVSVTLYPDMK